jgi:exonuclease VII large subunit
LLRETPIDDEAELDRLRARLRKLDERAAAGPWTRQTLELIAERPATRAADLSRALGRDKASFKTDVRKLKALGLTESLEVGYRLSQREAKCQIERSSLAASRDELVE